MGALREQAGNAYRYLRYLVRASTLLGPRRVACTVCGWQGPRFISDGWHQHTQCPRCRLGVRHRLLAAALAHLDRFSCSRLIQGKRVLHFAPERAFESMFRKVAGEYLTADLDQRRHDLRLDISALKEIGDAAFDVVIACDVLEHVADDRRALREITRILRPNGWAVLTVPQQDHRAITSEDGTAMTFAERERRFGQGDHVRIYGADFAQRVRDAGLEVHVVNHTDFPAEMVQRQVLFPPVLSTRPLATNYRNVFFGQKRCC